jgi:hypothetical protein
LNSYRDAKSPSRRRRPANASHGSARRIAIDEPSCAISREVRTKAMAATQRRNVAEKGA